MWSFEIVRLCQRVYLDMVGERERVRDKTIIEIHLLCVSECEIGRQSMCSRERE